MKQFRLAVLNLAHTRPLFIKNFKFSTRMLYLLNKIVKTGHDQLDLSLAIYSGVRSGLVGLPIWAPDRMSASFI